MAHALDPHYKDFGGVDSRSNVLSQNPKSARAGSLNFRWNYADRLQKMNGFQHKSAAEASCEAGLIEYKYKDLNTGQAKAQILGVSNDGKLRKRYTHNLHISVLNSDAAYYSFYYDGTTHKIDFLDDSKESIGSVDVSLTDTLDDLITAIDALSITGLTVSIQDDDGAGVVSSSLLAYLLDYKLEEDLTVDGISGSLDNPVYGWELISLPDGSVPFQEVVDNQSNTDYEGISYVNIYNSCFITSGGWVYKYDGFSLYRAGLPKTYEAYNNLGTYDTTISGHQVKNNALGEEYTSKTVTFALLTETATVASTSGYFIGMPLKVHTTGTLPSPLVNNNTYYVSRIISGTTFEISATYGGASITFENTQSGTHDVSLVGALYMDAGNHFFRFQLVYKDPMGAITYGKVQPFFSEFYGEPNSGLLGVTTPASTNRKPLRVYIPRIKNDSTFPVYACEINGSQTISGSGPHTLTVQSGHNISVGMVLRVYQNTYFGIGDCYYLEVTDVSTTTIEVNGFSTLPSLALLDTQVMNGCYVPDYAIGKHDSDEVPYGISWQLYGTVAGGTILDPGVFYKFSRFPVPAIASQEYENVLAIADVTLALHEEYNEETAGGEDLPRACKYLNKWQDQIFQAGRPLLNDLAFASYPTAYYALSSLPLPQDDLNSDNFLIYTESHLSDFQSIYWSDSLNPEGFSQSGLNEESFENNFNDQITGMMPNKEAIFVFKQRTCAYLTGQLAEGNLVKEFLEADVGAATQACIQEVRGTIVFMDENLGFWSVVTGRLPQFIGYAVQDIFKENYKLPLNRQFSFKRSKATNFRAEDQYICYIPAKDNNVDDSMIFVYDYAEAHGSNRNAWYIWNGLNAAGGVLATANDKLLIAQNQSSNNRLWQQKFHAGKYNYSNHTSAIKFNYKGSFINFSKPTIDKDFVRIVLNSSIGGFSLIVNQFANYIDQIISDFGLNIPLRDLSTLALKTDVKAAIPKLSAVSFGFYNNEINEDIQIDGWDIEYSASFDTGEVKK